MSCDMNKLVSKTLRATLFIQVKIRRKTIGVGPKLINSTLIQKVNMYQLARILFIVSLTSAKLKRNKDFLDISETNTKSNGLDDTLLVLNLNIDDLNFNKLFMANQYEEKIFEKLIAPAIQNYKLQKSRSVKKDDPMKILSEEEQQTFKTKELDKKYENLKDIKKEIKKILNKFLITHIDNSESYLIENSKLQPQLKIYFIGPYTSLILTSGKTRYQYFVNPPSPLPSWFYEYHRLEYGNKTYVDIPKNVQNDFLRNLLNLLTNFLNFPV